MMGTIVIGLRGIPEGLSWMDGLFFVIWALLLAYCLRTRPDTGSHEGAGDGLAFRSGKALKRVLYYRRRNTATSD
jgi:hypothetical protein